MQTTPCCFALFFCESEVRNQKSSLIFNYKNNLKVEVNDVKNANCKTQDFTRAIFRDMVLLFAHMKLMKVQNPSDFTL